MTTQPHTSGEDPAPEERIRLRTEELERTNLRLGAEIARHRLWLLKSHFVAMTSHEFRTPLATILSATELLEKYGELAAGGRAPRDAQADQDRGRPHDLDARGRAAARTRRRGPLRVRAPPHRRGRARRDFIEEARQSSGGRCRLQLVREGECGRREVDEKLLHHIVSNLRSNAVKYSPPDAEVQLRVACDDGVVRFTVRDRGIGIPPDHQPRLFSTFHRAGNVSNISGTELGLAIAKRCVDAHGGTIAFTSEVGRGSTFVVTIPDVQTHAP